MSRIYPQFVQMSPICPIVYWTDRRMEFLDFSRLFLYNKIVKR